MRRQLLVPAMFNQISQEQSEDEYSESRCDTNMGFIWSINMHVHNGFRVIVLQSIAVVVVLVTTILLVDHPEHETSLPRAAVPHQHYLQSALV